MKLKKIIKEAPQFDSPYQIKLKQQQSGPANTDIEVIKALLDFITSGDRYKSQNPYLVPAVEKAIEYYEKKSGKEYELHEGD